MGSILENLGYMEKRDPDGILSSISRFPVDARRAIEDADGLDLKAIRRKYNGLVVAGMGGSAVGGLLLRDWLRDACSVPIEVSRSYSLPRWVGEGTLVYAVSYSGDTEETLRQYQEALDRGCPVVCFCSGGKLSRSASLRKLPVFKYPKGYKPRAAIAHQFFSLAAVSRRLGLVGDEPWGEVEEALTVLDGLSQEMSPEVPIDSNPGKRLAESLHGYIPFIVGSEALQSVAYRYSTQFNENSKTPAAHSFAPEAFHNSVMAAEAAKPLLGRCCAVVVRDPLDAESSGKLDRFVELMAGSFARVVEVEALGRGRLARILSALYIGDFASVYLGILYGHDPGSTKSIDYLKQG